MTKWELMVSTSSLFCGSLFVRGTLKNQRCTFCIFSIVASLVICSVSFAQTNTLTCGELYAGNGVSPVSKTRDSKTRASQSDDKDRTKAYLGNPFGVETVRPGEVLITTVDDHSVWRINTKNDEIERIVGNGKLGYSGDGGPASQATMNWPHEIRVAENGDLFIADTRNHVIRKVDAATRVISTLAGDGNAGFAGEGKRGREVRFNQPHSVVLDGNNGVLVADTKNHRIRRIDLKSGIVSTISGTGKPQLPTDGAIAESSTLFGPRSLAVDDKFIWVVLREGNSVWRIDRGKGTIHHVAGTGKKGHSGDGGPPADATFRGPKGIALDAKGRVLIVDTENHAVRRIDLRSNQIETVAKLDRLGRMKRPHGIAPFGDDGFLVADSENHRVLFGK